MYPEVEGFPDQAQLYSGRRLLSSQGLTYPPLIDDTFTLRLPKPGTNFGREVRTSLSGHDRRFELWSPNSVQLPYYPGIRSSVLELRLSESLEQRRYDGKLGRFDPTLAPQYYDRRRPWLGMLVAPSSLSAFEISARAEYVPIIRVWEVSSEKPFLGKLREEFVRDLEEANRAAQAKMMGVGARIYRERVELWNHRPTRPLQREFSDLRSLTRFEQALDLGQELQRAIQERFAWARMAEAWLQFEGKEVELASVEILPANEEFIGVWVHGIEEADLKFFLGPARVPCFLVHELGNQDPTGELIMEDFVQGTPVADLLDPQKSEFDKVALFLNGGEHTPHDGSLPLPGVAFRPPADRLLSGSLAQWGERPLRKRMRSGSPGTVSIPESDEEGELLPGATVPTGSEWSAAPRSMIMGTEVTVPAIHGVTVTAVLKFTVPDAFALDSVIAWLTAAEQLSLGGSWRRIIRVESKPRAHYYVEFESAEAALRIKGLVDPREGLIRVVSFAKEEEFQGLATKHPVAAARPAAVRPDSPPPRVPTPAPYRPSPPRVSDLNRRRSPSPRVPASSRRQSASPRRARETFRERPPYRPFEKPWSPGGSSRESPPRAGGSYQHARSPAATPLDATRRHRDVTFAHDLHPAGRVRRRISADRAAPRTRDDVDDPVRVRLLGEGLAALRGAGPPPQEEAAVARALNAPARATATVQSDRESRRLGRRPRNQWIQTLRARGPAFLRAYKRHHDLLRRLIREKRCEKPCLGEWALV
ncbi:hypothetical protein K438DRAFT_1777081 [Mycena galopus ATCC 62051]|nr:hypothetical protein K438DRAFT_1777081 [Mycena galopus ATCC 62051]